MRQAIVTTTTQDRNGDFSIRCDAQWGTATHEWLAALDREDAHREAATQFAIDRGWLHRDPNVRDARLVGGSMPGPVLSFCWVLFDI